MQPAARPVFYDLSEIFLNGGARVKIYGVVRVIAEIGLELQRSGKEVRFVVFSPGHSAFFEVHPCFDRLHDDDAVDLAIPTAAVPKKLRRVFHRHRWLRRMAYLLCAPLINARNRRRWDAAGMTLPRADMTTGLLVTVARPKFIVDYLGVLQQTDTRLLAMLHDMIPLHEDPAGSAYQNFRGDNHAILRAAAGIVANSAFTRKEILRFVASGLLPAPARITTIGLAQECRHSSALAARPAPPGAYLLCVGSAVGRKNLETVFDALNLIRQGGSTEKFSIVIAGPTGRRTRDHLAQPAYDAIRAQLIFFDKPSHAELLQLYRQACAVIVPTRIEGWGLPAGEALWLGTPVICADIPALHEASDELALYFDPESPAQLAALITRIVGDQDFRHQLAMRICASRSRLRSWAQVADELFDEAQAYADTRNDALLPA